MIKKYRILVSMVILVVFLFFTPKISFSASYDPHLKYRTIDTKHFSIHYPASIEDVAQRAAKISEEVHETLSPKYEWVPWGKTQMLILDSSDSINDMASVLPYNWISLRVTAPGPDSSLNTYDDWLRMLILHEYTHILSLDKYKGFWIPLRILMGKAVSPNGVDPGWLTEGMATYEETDETSGGRGRATYSDMLLRTAILEGKFLPIDVADGLSWRWPGATARYIYGVKFMQYLAEHYGEDKLYEFIENVSGSPMLFMMNHQARRAFSKMEFETKKIHNRYVKEKKEGAPKSKTFYALWKEWKTDLEKKYFAEKENVSKVGITQLEKIISSKGTLTNPVVSPDGTKLLYSETTPYGPATLRIAGVDGGDAKRLLKNVYADQISFSREGSFIVYSKAGKYKTYSFFEDLYKYDFESKKVERLTNGARAKDPDLSPDGQEIVCVTQEGGSFFLNLYNIAEKTFAQLPNDFPKFTQFSSPRFSPDGKMIAAAVSVPGSLWDIYIFDKKGKIHTILTNDFEVDSDPVWSSDGKYLYFVSDRTGISNIFRYNLKSKKLEQVTNVLTGVFKPALTPDSQRLIVQYYNGEGYDLRSYNLRDAKYRSVEIKLPVVDKKIGKSGPSLEPAKEGLQFVNEENPATINVRNEIKNTLRAKHNAENPPVDDQYPTAERQYRSKKYSPFKGSLFLPRFIIPNAAYLDDSFLVGGYTGGSDPMKWHMWLAGITYRTDAKHVGYSFNYEYNKYKPIIDVGVLNYAVDFGEYRYTTGGGFHLFEKRIRGYAGVTYPMGKHAARIQYFYEDRQPTVSLTTAVKNYFNFDKFAGFNVGYGYNDAKKYPAGISKDDGRSVRLAFAITDKALGSSSRNEQYIFVGDWREYVHIWNRHVLAFKAAGGMTWGDDIRQGTFSLGGDIGEGTFASGGSLYYFPLRGLPVAAFSRDRAMLLSTEYRLPLITAARGLGTMPVFLDDIHFAIFADYGNAWDANQSTGSYFFNNFMLGVGGELRGDFILGHGLPITGRLGYGIIVVNRDRLVNFSSPIVGNSARSGMLILQVGTSF